MDQYSRFGFATRAIHAGQDADPATGATIVPIYATSTYTQAAPGQHKGYDYSRSGNPTRTALETCLAALESGEMGLAFASGLAATNALLAALLKPGDQILANADLYGGTYRILERVYRPWGLDARYTEDVSPAGFAAQLTSKTKVVWIETPTNPMLQVIDIAAVAELDPAQRRRAMAEAEPLAGDEVDRAGRQTAAGGEQRVIDGGGDLKLGMAFAEGIDAGLHRLVGDASRLADQCDLGRRFDQL